MREGDDAIYIGIVNRIIKRLDRRQREFAFVEMEDFTGCIEVTFFSDAYSKAREYIRKDAILLVRGQVNDFNEMKKIRADDAMLVEHYRQTKTTAAEVRLGIDEWSKGLINNLEEIAQRYPGDVIFKFRLNHPEGGFVVLEKPRPWKIEPSQEFIQDMQELKLQRTMRFTR